MDGKKILAYHMDLTRAMWTRSYMDSMITRLKLWGFNALLYEPENKLQYRRHRDLSHPDAFSADETRAFSAYCQVQGIEFIPLLPTLGQAHFVVGRPEYAHLREMPDEPGQYDPLSEAARVVIRELCDDVIDATHPPSLFHLGGDGSPSFGQGRRSLPVAKALGPGGLYLKHMGPLFDHMKRRGLRPTLWADMLERYPDALTDLPRDVLLIDRDYRVAGDRTLLLPLRETALPVSWDQYQQLELPEFRRFFAPHAIDAQTLRDGTFRGFFYIEALVKQGFDVVTASAARGVGDSLGIPNFIRRLPNAFASARKGMSPGKGHIVTSWANEHTHPEIGLPAVFAAAQALRGNESFDLARVARMFTADYFGAEMKDFGAVMEAMIGPPCLSHLLTRVDRRFRSDPAALSVELNALLALLGGKEAAIDAFHQSLDQYRFARAHVVDLGKRARRNADKVDYWLEGIDLNIFHAEWILSELENASASRAAGLIDKSAELSGKTRALFSRTYARHSVAEELEARYGSADYYLARRKAARG